LFIEYSFTIGGILSLIGLFFYASSFITASTGKIRLKKAVSRSTVCFCAFLLVQVLVVNQKNSFLVSTDGVFIAYMLILSVTTGIALSAGIPDAIKIGMFVFYLSDYIVYFQMAHGLLPIYRIVNAVLYYAAQIGMVFSLFRQGAEEIHQPDPSV
jgi:hypothetical protein